MEVAPRFSASGVVAALAAAALALGASAQSPLSTTFVSSQATLVGGAVYFDLQVATSVAITAIDINVAGIGGQTGALDVRTIAGGYVSNLGMWTGPAALANPVVGAPQNTPTTVQLQTPVTLAPGRWGVALVAIGFAHAYTPGTAAAATAELQLLNGQVSLLAFTAPVLPAIPNVAIHYTTAPGNVYANAGAYGAGCVGAAEKSFYEVLTAAAFDLAPPGIGSLTLHHTGADYTATTGLAQYVPPGPTAQTLSLGDDDEVMVTLSRAMPFGISESTSSLAVCSNGFVSTGSNGITLSTQPAVMLNHPNTGWYSLHDFNPIAGGAVRFEEVAGTALVTWDQVPAFGRTVGQTLQFQLDTATGDVSIVWVSIDPTSGRPHLVGFSSGGPSVDPGPIDLSAQVPLGVPAIAVFPIEPLTLTARSRPIANQTIAMRTANLGPLTLFGGVVFGLAQLPAPIDLGSLGMVGCHQYTDQLAALLFFPTGQPALDLPITVPNLVGFDLHAQAFSYDPFGALTAFGALASNAVRLRVGDW